MLSCRGQTWAVWLHLRGNLLIRGMWVQLWEQDCPQQTQYSKEVKHRGPANVFDDGTTQHQAHRAAEVQPAKDSSDSTRALSPA